MSFQSSPQTPRTHLILCLVLSAMLLLTFIFLLTLAIITPSWSPSFLHSLPTELFLRGDPVMGSGFALCLAGSPLSYIQVANISFPLFYPSHARLSPTLSPQVRKMTANPTFSKMKSQDSLPEQSYSMQVPKVSECDIIETRWKDQKSLNPSQIQWKSLLMTVQSDWECGGREVRERKSLRIRLPLNIGWNHLDFFLQVNLHFILPHCNGFTLDIFIWDPRFFFMVSEPQVPGWWGKWHLSALSTVIYGDLRHAVLMSQTDPVRMYDLSSIGSYWP